MITALLTSLRPLPGAARGAILVALALTLAAAWPVRPAPAWAAPVALAPALGTGHATSGAASASDGSAEIPSSPPKPVFRGPISLNRASLPALESLPGIGPALAKRIVEGRPYLRVEDLDRVKGIGPKKMAALRPLVVVDR